MSGNSWANMGQECIKCHINVYPHKQVRGGVQGAGGGAGACSGREEGQGSSGGVLKGLHLEQIGKGYLFPY